MPSRGTPSPLARRTPYLPRFRSPAACDSDPPVSGRPAVFIRSPSSPTARPPFAPLPSRKGGYSTTKAVGFGLLPLAFRSPARRGGYSTTRDSACSGRDCGLCDRLVGLWPRPPRTAWHGRATWASAGSFGVGWLRRLATLGLPEGPREKARRLGSGPAVLRLGTASQGSAPPIHIGVDPACGTPGTQEVYPWA